MVHVMKLKKPNRNVFEKKHKENPLKKKKQC